MTRTLSLAGYLSLRKAAADVCRICDVCTSFLLSVCALEFPLFLRYCGKCKNLSKSNCSLKSDTCVGVTKGNLRDGDITRSLLRSASFPSPRLNYMPPIS